MLINTFRNFFTLIAAIFSFYKLLNLDFNKKQVCPFVISSLAIGYTVSFLFLEVPSLNWILLLLLFLLLIKFVTKLNTTIIYTTSLFSFALSFISLNLSCIIITFSLLPFYYGIYELPWIFIHICYWILQFLLLYFCFCIPRLRKGMTFLHNISSNNIGSSFCLFAIASVIIFCQAKTYDEKIILSFSTILFIFGFLLIYWWNYHITQTYRKYLKENEIHTLNLLLEEKNREIAKLRRDNDRLSSAIHKDNKIIPIIYNAIFESNEKNIPLDLSQWETDSPLCRKLKQLYGERGEILKGQEIKNENLPKTAFEFTNATLSFMYSEAKKSDIPFQVVLFDDLKSTIPIEITEDDFNHMLSDLLANALNACTNISGASILVYLGKPEGISTIRILNTGNVFHIETLKNLGLARHTTHPDTGGSGIGLMDIWMLKEKYKATLLIDEIAYESSFEIYTCVNILFNHKNHYIIQSDRHKELSTYINRPDIMILSKN